MEERTVDAEWHGRRLDQYVSEALNVSRGQAQKAIGAGSVTVNGVSAKPSRLLHAGDVVSAETPEPIAAVALAEDIPLDIVYEDGSVLVINKPRGMVVHPAPGNEDGTLVNAVLGHSDDLSGIGGELRPGIVHRLDKDTSGLLVVAKTDAAHVSLQSQIQAKTAERRYDAVVWSNPQFERAMVEAPIGRHPNDRKKMAVITDPRQPAREATTELIVTERFGLFTLLEARLLTGRTHQIRVHCAYIGHPVVGDLVYGGIRRVPPLESQPRVREALEAAIGGLNGQALHAKYLAFNHPATGERMTFEAAAPNVVVNLLAVIRQYCCHREA